jgi:hypothetical protein
MRAPRQSSPAYEVRDVAPRHIGYSAAVLFVGLAVSVGLVAGLFAVLDHFVPKPPATAMETAPLAPPLPRLEIDGRADRAAVEVDAQGKLEGYAWADPAADTARIPIERAMQLLVMHGWPDRDKGPGTP